ncbi:snapalysin [Streptomyces hiroshimensis]|uniref:Extracellular small neutral protease n=1 Tax=Streptomyces hiroshimensis TaxID=66424 RepID=A0ABQ2Y785_9ACTN|nr:snapalysin [Streptomyces hiroshimensis]GGX71787.1 extracellular small neutral protease [Streptomyces hiroshimensis]
MKRSTTVLSAAIGLGIAAAMTAVPASAAPAITGSQTATQSVRSSYAGSAAEEAGNKAFFDAVMKSAQAKAAKSPGLQTVTVTYDPSRAPSFASQIAASAQIWNSSVRNVQLRAGSNADFSYYEGNDSRGSYASTDGHGRGYIFLDYRQNQQYNSTRVTAHETGHVLGLPDHYSGPCSELMSGGGPGTSCQNTRPNSAESSRVNQLWANGLSAFKKDDKGVFTTVR